jgi:CRISPR-associated protein Cmr1
VTEVSHTFKVITPIFGGGPVSKESDPVTPIRTAGLKGQFRFWWRAARAGGKDLQKLREEEARLWGGPNEEGVLSIFLQGQPQVEKEEWFQLNRKGTREEPKDGFKILAYAGFPLQRTSDEVKLRAPVRTVARCTGECTVTVKIDKKNPEYKKGDEEEAEAALWAWSLFGGVGGRTRRGFGAVSC